MTQIALCFQSICSSSGKAHFAVTVFLSNILMCQSVIYMIEYTGIASFMQEMFPCIVSYPISFTDCMCVCIWTLAIMQVPYKAY